MSSHFIKQLNTKCRFRGGLFDKLDDKLNPLLELKEDMLWGILSKLIESFKFASHKKITKLEWRPWILVKLSFRELAIQSFYLTYFKLVKVFKSRPSKICGTQPLKNLKWYGPFIKYLSWNLVIFRHPLPFVRFPTIDDVIKIIDVLFCLDPFPRLSVRTLWIWLQIF